jgi:tRNA U34 2-thiouridine synthase MnmA/TrmU
MFSGGLVSQLAVCVIKDQGIDVGEINFVTQFFGQKNEQCGARDLGIDYYSFDFGPEYRRF